MPPKTCTCVICGEQVTKAKTYAVQKGRACRTHEGVQETRDQRVAEQNATLRAAVKKKKSRPEQKSEPFQAECICCGGVLKTKKQWFLDTMASGLPLYHPEVVQSAFNQVGVPLLLSGLTEHNQHKAMARVKPHLREQAWSLGVLVCCQNCIETMCLVPEPKTDQKKSG